MNLFNLFAKLTLDNKDYEEKLDKSKKSVSSFASKAGTAFKAGAKAVIGFATAITAGVTAVVGITSKVADFSRNIDTNAKKTGMSTDAYQKWSMALKLCGIEQNDFIDTTKEMTNYTNRLNEGNAEALITLQKLGLGYEDFMNMSPEEQFKALVESLQGVEDQTEKTRLAQQVFGSDAYLKLIPALKMEVGSIDELFKEVEDLGLVMSEDAVKAGKEFGDQLDIMKQKIVIAGTSIVSDFLPSASLFLEGVLDLVTGTEGGTEKMVQSFGDMTDGILDLIVGLIDNLPNILPQLAKMSTQLFTKVLDALGEIDLGDLILTLIETGIDYALYDLPALIEKFIGTFFKLISNLFSADNLARFGKLAVNLGITLVNSLIEGLNKLGNFTIPGLQIAGIQLWEDITVSLFKIPTIPLVQFAEGGMFNDLLKGTAYAVAGESGAEIVAQGRHGTGVANVEQIADAQYMAMEDYGLREEIARAAEAVVNGVVMGLRANQEGNERNSQITLKIGDRSFKAYIVDATNQNLKSKGRKTLNTITAY